MVITQENVLEMEKRLNSPDMSFNMSGDDDDDAAYLAPENTLVSSTASPELMLEASDSKDWNSQQLSEAMEQLDDRSKTIVKRRWLSDTKATVNELADEYGVSAERIRQIESNAFKTIKATFVA